MFPSSIIINKTITLPPHNYVVLRFYAFDKSIDLKVAEYFKQRRSHNKEVLKDETQSFLFKDPICTAQ
jgi:hypothetical protein